VSALSFLSNIQPSDLFIVGTLVILEGLLSADNALVLALLVRHLPDEQQKKALQYGLLGAFTLRGIGIYLARYIVGLWWLCGLGALYLIFLAVKHFVQRHGEDHEEAMRAGRKMMGFWQTVAVVEFTDVVFAVDSIWSPWRSSIRPKTRTKCGSCTPAVSWHHFAAARGRRVHRADSQVPRARQHGLRTGRLGGVKLIFTSAICTASPCWATKSPNCPSLVLGRVHADRHSGRSRRPAPQRNAADIEEQQELDESLDDLRDSGFVPGGARVFDRPTSPPAVTSAGPASSGSER
jgi:threonine/homoserine/homoserine lactone efflux protein